MRTIRTFADRNPGLGFGRARVRSEERHRGRPDDARRRSSPSSRRSRRTSRPSRPPRRRPQRPQVDPNKVYEIPVANSAVRGPKDAPVTIVMFSDFQCPFCAQAVPIVDDVLKAYPNDVNFVMKQFPLRQIHPNADPAARAAIAAGKQGKFWEMHDELYKNNRNLTPGDDQGHRREDRPRHEEVRGGSELRRGEEAGRRRARARRQESTCAARRASSSTARSRRTARVDGFKAQIDAELKAKKKG